MSGYAVAHLDEIAEIDRRPGALAARPAPLRDHVLRRQRVDRAERGRPDHQRARRGRGGAGTRSSTSSRAAAPGSSSTASGSRRPRARSSSSAPGVKRTAFAEEPETTIVAIGGMPGRAYEPDGWEIWAPLNPLYEAGEYGEAADRGRELAELIPSTRGCSTTWRAARASPDGRAEAIEHLRLAIERSDRSRSSPPATPTSIRFATTPRSKSWSGRPDGATRSACASAPRACAVSARARPRRPRWPARRG